MVFLFLREEYRYRYRYRHGPAQRARPPDFPEVIVNSRANSKNLPQAPLKLLLMADKAPEKLKKINHWIHRGNPSAKLRRRLPEVGKCRTKIHNSRNSRTSQCSRSTSRSKGQRHLPTTVTLQPKDIMYIMQVRYPR